MDPAGRFYEPGEKSCDETIRCSEIRCPLPGTIQDWKLLFDEKGHGDHGADTARPPESGHRNVTIPWTKRLMGSSILALWQEQHTQVIMAKTGTN